MHAHTTISTPNSQVKDYLKHPVLKWGPSAVGLAVIPFLPYVDEPIEHGVERLFAAVWPVPPASGTADKAKAE
jgi:hypothetical protein